jgi:hypothetical protein
MVLLSSFTNAAAFDLTLPTPSVSDQKITINGNGTVFYRGSDLLDASEILRATVNLASGRSNPSTPTAYTAIASSGGISVTVTYPLTIRSDYPDTAIAGAATSIGFQVNAPFVCLYVQRQSDGQIREFISYATTATATQVFTVTSFSGTVIGSLPNTAGDFGLFASTPASTISEISGSLAADNYRVHWGFRYDGTTISDINHAASGAINEFRTSMGDLSTQIATYSASQAASRFLASPSGSSGVPSFRAIAAADVPPIPLGFSAQTTDYTLVLADYLPVVKVVQIDSAIPCSVNVPLNSSVEFPIGAEIPVSRDGIGAVLFVPAVGVTLNSADGRLRLRSQFSVATLIKTAINTWLLVGDLSA